MKCVGRNADESLVRPVKHRPRQRSTHTCAHKLGWPNTLQNSQTSILADEIFQFGQIVHHLSHVGEPSEIGSPSGSARSQIVLSLKDDSEGGLSANDYFKSRKSDLRQAAGKGRS